MIPSLGRQDAGAGRDLETGDAGWTESCLSCDDPSSAKQMGSESVTPDTWRHKETSAGSLKAQVSESSLQHEQSTAWTEEDQGQTESSNSSSESGTGFAKGSRLDPRTSVVLVLEIMSQRRLKVESNLQHKSASQSASQCPYAIACLKAFLQMAFMLHNSVMSQGTAGPYKSGHSALGECIRQPRPCDVVEQRVFASLLVTSWTCGRPACSKCYLATD